jgi:hypothetical protein
MSKVAIYKHDENTVSVVYPSDEALAIFDIYTIAKKSIPSGKKFKILDNTALPQTREQKNAWIVNEKDLTDGVGEA